MGVLCDPERPFWNKTVLLQRRTVLFPEQSRVLCFWIVLLNSCSYHKESLIILPLVQKWHKILIACIAPFRHPALGFTHIGMVAQSHVGFTRGLPITFGRLVGQGSADKASKLRSPPLFFTLLPGITSTYFPRKNYSRAHPLQNLKQRTIQNVSIPSYQRQHKLFQ